MKIALAFLFVMILQIQSSIAIVGGTDVDRTVGKRIDASVAATVLLKANGFYFCSGILIDRRVILTAAHCIGDYLVEEIRVGFAAAEGVEATLNGMKIHPEFKYGYGSKDLSFSGRYTSLLANDLAVFLLTEDAPQAARPALLPAAPIPVGPTDSMHILGYGRTDFSRGDIGVLREIRVTGRVESDRKGKIVIDQTHGRGVCNGDSGGPFYYNSEGSDFVTLVGVTSDVDDYMMTNGRANADSCRHLGVATQVGAHLQFIRDAITELRGDQ